jgi:hypothetical protein
MTVTETIFRYGLCNAVTCEWADEIKRERLAGHMKRPGKSVCLTRLQGCLAVSPHHHRGTPVRLRSRRHPLWGPDGQRHLGGASVRHTVRPVASVRH